MPGAGSAVPSENENKEKEMSRANKMLKKELVTFARRAGGSFKTVADRSRIATQISARMMALNIQIRSVSNIKTQHIVLYIRSRQADNISKRTLQNEMAAIRGILAAAGRPKLADPHHEWLSNHALGISGASRDGTKIAISDERFSEALALARSKDEGVAIAMRLSRYLGLRTEETVQSAKSVRTWQQAIIKGHDAVRVVFGTKGGRPRNTTIINKVETIKAINDAAAYIKEHNGKLIDSTGLKSAISRYRNITEYAGLKGKISPHSLRYAYAQDATKYYLAQGYSQKEAEAMVSMDLGHGDGRGQYVARVYNRTSDE